MMTPMPRQCVAGSRRAVDLARPHLRRKAVGQMRPRRPKPAAIGQSQIRRKLRVVLSLARRPQLPATQVAVVKARNARRNPLQISAQVVLIGDEEAAETTLMVVSVIRQRSAQVPVTDVTKTDHQIDNAHLIDSAHQIKVEPPLSGREGVMMAATIVNADDLDLYWK